MPHRKTWKLFVALVCWWIWVPCASAQPTEPIRIGIVTFLSGPGAGPFGVPARNAAELTFDALNAGTVPAPYQTKGFGGTPVEMVVIDEAGPVSSVVTQYRNLVQRDVDIVIGYVSSGSCLAIAPVAEELKKLTVFFDCGTPRVFEDASYRYVFRTASHATMDNVARGEVRPGQLPRRDAHRGHQPELRLGPGFMEGLRDLDEGWWCPGLRSRPRRCRSCSPASTGPRSRPCSRASRTWSIPASGAGTWRHSSCSPPRATCSRAATCCSPPGETLIHRPQVQVPDGTVIGARGPHSVFAPDNELNRWFRSTYEKRYGAPPPFSSYHMVQAILGTKAAYEKAKAAANGKAPDQDQIAAAFEGLSFETPSGTTKMALGKGHQGIQGTAYGMTKSVQGRLTITNVTRYAAEEVNPPEGVKSEDWIRSGFKR